MIVAWTLIFLASFFSIFAIVALISDKLTK